MSRKFVGFALRPSTCETRAAMGTAETPAEPIRGLTLPLVTRYMSLPRSTPPAVEKQNAVRPRMIMNMVCFENDNLDCVKSKEVLTGCGCTYSCTKEDCDNIHKLVLSCFAESFNNAALSEQVAEHEHADKRSDGWKHESADDKHDDGEYNLLCLADGSELLHLDRALFLRGEQLHDGRLNNRDKSHIRICRNCYRCEQVSCKL